MEKKPEVVIQTAGKTGPEIIEQEMKAIMRLWPSDYLIIEHSPLK
jgi:hypothetical protein